MGETIERVLDSDTSDSEAIRAAALEAIEEDGMTRTSFAKAANVAMQTMSAWLNGTYAGNNPP